MSHRGYDLEHEVETWLLDHAGQTRDMPMYSRSHRITSSGAMRGDKGDIISCGVPWLPKQLMFECKKRTTVRKKNGRVFTLDTKWLPKLVEEAGSDYIPLLMFSFGKANKYRKWVAYRAEDGLISERFNCCNVISKSGKVILYHSILMNGVKGNSEFGFEIRLGDDIWGVISWDYFVKQMYIRREEWTKIQVSKT